MNDTLRSMRLGAVALFGVAIPGFLLIALASVGLLTPLLAIALHVTGDEWGRVVESVYGARWIAVGVVLVLSYVAGYILRLTSPDKLDRISTKHVLRELGEEERRVWPSTGGDNDKFPYFKFGQYLKERGHDDLLEHVPWGEDGNEGSAKRSKTFVHKMKMDIYMEDQRLSDLVDSNEAHIRLMAGTWLAIRTTTWTLWVGMFVAVIGLTTPLWPYLAEVDRPPYGLFAVVNGFMLVAGSWGTRRIEALFHYRRVNELVFLTMAADVVRSKPSNMALQSDRSMPGD